MKLSPEKQKQLALTLLVVVGVNVCAWWFGVQGLTGKKASDTKKLEKIKSEVGKCKDKIKKETEDRASAQVYKEYIVATEEKIPKTNVETWFLNELTQMATRQKLSLSSSPIQDLDEQLIKFKFKDMPYKLVGLRFELIGELHDIGKFIEDIENNRPLMEVHEITITTGSPKGVYSHTVVMLVSMVKQG